MTSVLVLAAIWVVVGIPAVVAILREKRSPDLNFARAMDALGTQPSASNTHLRVSLATRRAQVTGGCYASATAVLVAGLAARSDGLLAVGIMLGNLGTFYRLTVLRMRAVSAQRHVPAPMHSVSRVNSSLGTTLPRIPPTTLGPAIERIPERSDDERVVIIG